jgi:hypothetical protein
MVKAVGGGKQREPTGVPGSGLGRAISRAELSVARLADHLDAGPDPQAPETDAAARKLARRDALKHAAERAAAKKAAAGAGANPGTLAARTPPAGSRVQAGRPARSRPGKVARAKKK